MCIERWTLVAFIFWVWFGRSFRLVFSFHNERISINHCYIKSLVRQTSPFTYPGGDPRSPKRRVGWLESSSGDWVNEPIHPLEAEMASLKNQLDLIEALEERNKAQLDSFVDELDQFNSLEPEERELLQSKEQLLKRMDILADELVQMWMGQKTMDG